MDRCPDVCESDHAMAKRLRCYLGFHRWPLAVSVDPGRLARDNPNGPVLGDEEVVMRWSIFCGLVVGGVLAGGALGK